ncbi:hypothetical protein AVEN_255966-1 [Araneus ventricosus]|uniref:Uncharacterized protein n=1 Tax=Araneus ventricosus TaxID=182803 RepID=A0A4Y2MKC6_ARAVE|nr:hypothetical protein AVEN_255966-1 [Araneus ventricosus]
MEHHFLIFLTLSVFIHSSLSAEKVLFGQPAPITAEARQTPAADAAKEITPKDGRKARVFTFPGATQQQDSRTHQPAYVISSPYESTEDRFSTAGSSGLSDENRLLSLLPSFGENGMQVGLDFKLPFFSIPYAKMFNALSAPSVGGGLGSLFGAGSPYGSPSAAASSLTSNVLGSGSGISSTVATVAAMAVTAAMLYPKVTGLFSGDGNTFRDGGNADDFFQNVNSVLNQFNIDGEACMKVALCSLGNAKRQHTRRGRDTTSTLSDVVEDVLNRPAVKKFMNKGGLVQARDFGGSGGDCEYFNSQNKCPIAAQTFKSMLSKLG